MYSPVFVYFVEGYVNPCTAPRICQLSQSPRSLRTRRSDFLEGMREDHEDEDEFGGHRPEQDEDPDTSRDTTGEDETNQVRPNLIIVHIYWRCSTLRVAM